MIDRKKRFSKTKTSITQAQADFASHNLKAATDHVLEKLRVRMTTPIRGFPTGYKFLDEMLSGLNKGDLIAVAGHQGMGCTSFALNIAEHLAVDEGIGVLYFSLGMCDEYLIERMLLGRARIDQQKVRRTALTDSDWDKIDKTAKFIAEKPLYIDDASRLTIDELCDRSQALMGTKKIQLIVVDYLQQLRRGPNIDLTESDIAEISRRLKLLALQLNVPVLVLVELSFALIREDEERLQPRIADLCKAIMVERYADVLILINREQYWNACPPDSRHTELIITKNKNGSTGFVSLDYWHEYMTFKNPYDD